MKLSLFILIVAVVVLLRDNRDLASANADLRQKVDESSMSYGELEYAANQMRGECNQVEVDYMNLLSSLDVRH